MPKTKKLKLPTKTTLESTFVKLKVESTFPRKVEFLVNFPKSCQLVNFQSTFSYLQAYLKL